MLGITIIDDLQYLVQLNYNEYQEDTKNRLCLVCTERRGKVRDFLIALNMLVYHLI